MAQWNDLSRPGRNAPFSSFQGIWWSITMANFLAFESPIRSPAAYEKLAAPLDALCASYKVKKGQMRLTRLFSGLGDRIRSPLSSQSWLFSPSVYITVKTSWLRLRTLVDPVISGLVR